jgi:hypothetical protein
VNDRATLFGCLALGNSPAALETIGNEKFKGAGVPLTGLPEHIRWMEDFHEMQ